MIQAITESTFYAYISTEDNRIDTSVASTQIRHLVKFINDMDGSVQYAYGAAETIFNRYTKITFNYNVAPDIYAGDTKLIPSGYYKYEVYEVSWIGAVAVSLNTAPSSETDVLPVANTNGVVQGIVTKGKLNLTDLAGTAQVQYTEHDEPSATNYLYYGQDAIVPFANTYSLDFDGVDDYVDFGDESVFTPNASGSDKGFSISFWIKLPSGGTSSQKILAKSDFFSAGAYRYEYNLRTSSASKVNMIFYGGDDANIKQNLVIDTALVADTWYHLAFTFNLEDASTSIVGYLDGSQKTNGSGATYGSLGTWAAVSNTVAPLQIGRVASNFGALKLDEIALFDTVLSAGAVTSIYNAGTPTDLSSQVDLLGYWRNGDTAGTSVYPTIKDDSSNSNDGTMINMVAGDIITDAP